MTTPYDNLYLHHPSLTGRSEQVPAGISVGLGDTWRSRICEFAAVITLYVALALLGQLAAIPPGNVTPIYPAAGFAMACVLLRGPRVWPGIWLGQLLGNAWAFVDFSDAATTLATFLPGVVTACGAVLQALVGACLIVRLCGTRDPFQQLRHLFAFVGIVTLACWISAATGITGMTISGVLPAHEAGATLLTWYFGDLVGTVLCLPLIVTCQPFIRAMDKTQGWETGLLLSPLLVFGLVVFLGYMPLQLASNSLLLLSLPWTLWAAFRLAQPGVAMLVNTFGILATFLTIRGVSPFFANNTNVALELFQLVIIVTMIAGLSLAIAIQQLKDTRSSFRKLWLAIDRAGDAVFLVHPDASFEYVNARATKLLGYSYAELTSMAVFDIDPNFTPAAWPDVWSNLQREELHFESVIRCRNGTEVPVDISVAHLDVDGTELACAILKDISQRKRAEEARSVFEQILDSTSAVIYQKDLDGRYEFVNQRWRTLFDIDPAEAKGKTDYDLFPSQMAAAFRHNDEQVVEQEASLQIEETAPHADGPHTYVSVKFPVWDERGRVRGIAGISTDISEQLAAKEKLQNSERLATIGKMITGLGHECRNALQRSQACLSMLNREIRDRPKASDYADRLQQAQDDLQHVFKELRGYASPLHLEKTTADLQTLMEQTWEHITSVPNPPDARLRIVASKLDLHCHVDAFRIQQVFRNVLENAISVAPVGSTIAVRWSRADLTERPALRVTIQDEGPGFAAEQRANAFQPFYTTKVTGTGLGLTICRSIVECHDGEIHIADGSHSGGIVVITLPQQERNESWQHHLELASRKTSATCESSMK